MIKQVIRLVRPGLFLPCFAVETPEPADILIRPRWFSVCAADQRYFQGKRAPDILARRLPMALFHEAVGEVLRDPSGELARGSFCVLLPCGAEGGEGEGRYRHDAFFRSSTADGFCQEVLCLKRTEVLPVPGEEAELYVLTEPLSVCCQALRRLLSLRPVREDACLGVWGDGPMGFLMALTLRQLLPRCRLTVTGRHSDKLALFTFCDERRHAGESLRGLSFDVAFECVGGANAQSAIAQAVEALLPCGTLILLGVSELPVPVPTREVLEKGLLLLGSSRSEAKDFHEARQLVDQPYVRGHLRKLCMQRLELSEARSLPGIMRKDEACPGKTLIVSTL